MTTRNALRSALHRLVDACIDLDEADADDAAAAEETLRKSVARVLALLKGRHELTARTADRQT